MKNILYDTTMLNEKIQVCEDLDEYKQEIIANIDSAKQAWIGKIKEILDKTGYTKSKLAMLCEVSRVAVNKWFNGAIPRQREMFIRIGFAAGYNLEEMNKFLIRYGRYQGLYAKSLEDSICIFVLSSNELEHSYQVYSQILSKIKEGIEGTENGRNSLCDTTNALNKLLSIHSENELYEFIADNIGIYRSQYNKFYNYVLGFLQINKINFGYGEGVSTHFLAKGQSWSSSLRQCVSSINQRKWYPIRDKIISLGLHLNMDVEQINEMLELAHMERLCAKNIFESAVIYALENAKLEDVIFCDGTDALCIYVKNILEELQIEESEFFLDELPNEY